ncbi:hypothetical protein BJY01DRAFT_249727 [Aspergillus pseudoustus]|uniref:Transcription factor domain-containing protein n=1 Tax=Aspergillus pseudoustus TaxID=1810923 RepID=A0ABR4JPJ5_9EURO
MRRCWQVNTVACRLIAALDRRMAQDPMGDCLPMNAASFSLVGIKCYVFDKALSANIYQPPPLIEFRLRDGVMDYRKPAHAVLAVLLDLAHIHHTMIREARKWTDVCPTTRADLRDIRALRPLRNRIWDKIEEYRQPSLYDNEDFVVFEWQTVQFAFLSTMLSITRLGAGTMPEARQECVMLARLCLTTLKAMLQQAGHCPHLDQVVPLFILRPVYLLFNHIVNVADPLDLELLQDITGSLRHLAESNTAINSITLHLGQQLQQQSRQPHAPFEQSSISTTTTSTAPSAYDLPGDKTGAAGVDSTTFASDLHPSLRGHLASQPESLYSKRCFAAAPMPARALSASTATQSLLGLDFESQLFLNPVPAELLQFDDMPFGTDLVDGAVL